MQIKPEISKETTQEQLGIQLTTKFAEGLGDAEGEITSFLADLKGIDKERIQQYSFSETFALIEELKEQEDLKGFFMQVAKLTK